MYRANQAVNPFFKMKYLILALVPLFFALPTKLEPETRSKVATGPSNSTSRGKLELADIRSGNPMSTNHSSSTPFDDDDTYYTANSQLPDEKPKAHSKGGLTSVTKLSSPAVTGSSVTSGKMPSNIPSPNSRAPQGNPRSPSAPRRQQMNREPSSRRAVNDNGEMDCPPCLGGIWNAAHDGAVSCCNDDVCPGGRDAVNCVFDSALRCCCCPCEIAKNINDCRQGVEQTADSALFLGTFSGRQL